MTGKSRQPGWDKQAVNEIAASQYGSLKNMFDAHGWDKADRTFGQIAPSRVKETYGGVEAFVKAHEDGRAGNPMLDPLVAIRSDPPQVFLKSFHGFTPESWGFLGYTEPSSREKFVRESRPGALLVVCGTSKAPIKSERLRVLGMQQQTHIYGSKWEFLDPARHEEERNDPKRVGGWINGLKAIRAWKIPEEDRPFVRDIFPETHKGGDNGTAIGSYGLRLTSREALRILDLPLYEVPVFGGAPVDSLIPGPAAQTLAPSKPGPVAQSGYMVREAEGPKHLYILRMHGDEYGLLGEDPKGGWIVKVGFSGSPDTRCKAHNTTLPRLCAYQWAVLKSTFDAKRPAFPSSRHALAGEQAMKDSLVKNGRSLGGEFFLANQSAIEMAWAAGIAAAEQIGGGSACGSA
ncbi:hypothetical protein [Qipengyuania atrilutea]|uniref:Uncharacterized protein n=1 Tax=Qipengyuania atrilutea TaxID=2744473 RepID=A0A850H6N8_9SPHN|nr:hypothetical protein [Actirhodobacter atriluteus]NVD46137.1 hypothetical protein [Actirhodobacter atriluteus]